MRTTKRKFIIYTNSTFEEEKALVERKENGEKHIVVMKGDYYHDKIDEKINGFLLGLQYSNIEYELKEIEVFPNLKLFEELDFYLEEEKNELSSCIKVFDELPFDLEDEEILVEREEKKENSKEQLLENRTKDSVFSDFQKEENYKIYEIKSSGRDCIIRTHPLIAILWAWNLVGILKNLETGKIVYDFRLDFVKKEEIILEQNVKIIANSKEIHFYYKNEEINIDDCFEKFDIKDIKLNNEERYILSANKGDIFLWQCDIDITGETVEFYATPIAAVIYAWNNSGHLYKKDDNSLVYSDELLARENNEYLDSFGIYCKDVNFMDEEDIDSFNREFYRNNKEINKSLFCKFCEPKIILRY